MLLEIFKHTYHSLSHTHTRVGKDLNILYGKKKHINGHWETHRCVTSLVISEIKSKSKWENILIYQNKTIKDNFVAQC